MAEFCLKCHNEINEMNLSEFDVLLLYDLCEGCVEWKPCVIIYLKPRTVLWTLNAIYILIKRLFKSVKNVVKRAEDQGIEKITTTPQSRILSTSPLTSEYIIINKNVLMSKLISTFFISYNLMEGSLYG